jgi:predicted HicB family RNase H-like nuclease
MNNKYSINVVWSDEDECFVATIPEFPLLSAFGETQIEAIADAEVVLKMALDSLKEDGIEPPKYKKVEHRQYSGQVRLRMPRTLHKELTVAAADEGASLNTYLVMTLVKHLAASRASREVIDKIDRILDQQNQQFATMVRKINQNERDADYEEQQYGSFFGGTEDYSVNCAIMDN